MPLRFSSRAAARGAAVPGLLLACALALPARSAPVSVPSPELHALVGGRVIVAPGRELPRATVLVRDGRIVAVGEDVRVPAGARTWDCTGLVVSPGFVDAHLSLSRLNGVAPTEREGGSGDDAGSTPAPAPSAAGAPAPSATGWGHPSVHPEVRTADWLKPDAEALKALRAQGFTAACVVPDTGILRGRDCVIALSGEEPGRSVIADLGDVHAAFETQAESHPDSVMGATAVLRQALIDAGWYRAARAAGSGDRIAEDVALQALQDVLPAAGARRGAPRSRLAFACADVLDALRAGAVAQEAGAALRLRGAGDEYRRLGDVVALGVPLVLPVAFPAPPRVVDETEWLSVSNEQLRHWRHAPDNPRWLHEAGADVSLTTDGLKDVADFTARVRKAIDRGLRPDDALAMLTTHPAAMLGLSDRLGTIEPGKLAHLLVTTQGPLAEGSEIRDAWVDGRRHVVSRPPDGPLGTWAVSVQLGGRTFPATLELSVKDGTLSWDKGIGGPGEDAGEGGRSSKVSGVRVEGPRARFDLEGEPLGATGPLAAQASVGGDGRILASAEAASLSLSGERKPKDTKKKDDEGKDEPQPPLPPPRPESGPLTAGDDALFRNATIWTCGPDGILEGADVLVRDGVIRAVGKGLAVPSGVVIVDMTGRHLTPGLIDAHSHSAIVGGVNEGTNSCTAEVRIGDVVNSETIDVYRLLAGGLTTANLLHGSANCMGGQSQVIRLKWGASPEGLKFREATPAIKFALGENVKQSNWGEKYVTRYPQTRMGVEQFMREKFQEARDWDEHRGRRPARGELPPRRDLQLECLAEILRGERKIHCHSYRQDEILGFMRVSEEFGFRIGTFQHVLEGYKVADEMAAHGAAGSSFTDWWAYKFEVYDAIPHNPALMWERGVLTSVNSDSTELARRMQLEAAKVVKWGGVPEAEALKFVTLNPAKQLGIDAVVGSIEPGKQADLAAWTGSPLSTSSLCESTWIQGVKYFDRGADLAARQARTQERAALVERAREARESGEEADEEFSPSYLQAAHGCSEEGGVHGHGGHAVGVR